jgi:MFS transporter, Spinster family, sphingosine-1-phosphate transporter
MAFFLVHALATFPLGWLADRIDRRKVIGLGIIAWSIATLGSAYAWGFLSMLIFRSAIGIGEAAYGAPANALLCETFPEKKSLLVGIFNAGMFLGACVGMALGATLGFPHAFQAVAIPGLFLGVLVIRMKVPPQRTAQTAAPLVASTMFRDGLKALRIPTLRWMLPAGVLISFAAGGYIDWIVDFTVRYKGMTKEQAVPIYFLITLTGGGLGVVVAGLVADRLQRLRATGRALTMTLGFAGAVPFAILVVVIDHGWPYFVCGWFVLFFLPWYNGPMAAIIDDVVDDSQASTAQATFVFFLHLLGTGPGGLVLGFVSRYYTLKHAFILPAIAITIAAFCAWRASRHVAADIAARNARAARPEPEPGRLAACAATSS